MLQIQEFFNQYNTTVENSTLALGDASQSKQQVH